MKIHFLKIKHSQLMLFSSWFRFSLRVSFKHQKLSLMMPSVCERDDLTVSIYAHFYGFEDKNKKKIKN